MDLIPITIEGTTYPMRPFRFGFNGADDYRLIGFADFTQQGLYTDPVYNGYVPGTYATELYDVGDVLNLRSLFEKKYREYKAANVAVESEYKLACQVDIVYNGNINHDVSLYYKLVYNPTYPNILKVITNGGAVRRYPRTNEGGVLIDQRDIAVDIDYSAPFDPSYNFAITIIKYYNCPDNCSDYEGSEGIFIGPPNTAYNVSTGFTISLPDIIHQELQFNLVPYSEFKNSEEAGNAYYWSGDTPRGYIMTYDHHDNSNISTLPYRASGGLGYTMVNTAEVDKITIADAEWSLDDSDDSQSSFVPSAPYGKNPFSESSDYLPVDGLPLYDILDTGFVHAYVVGSGGLVQLSNFLLSDDFLQNVKNLFQNPIDYILTLMSMPVAPTNTEQANIQLGGVTTDIIAQKINKSLVTFDCGGVKCSELWKGFIDYAPITRVSVFIPFVGVQELNTDDIMDGVVHVIYRIDTLTGTFNVSLEVSNSRGTNGVLYAYEGTMGYQIPIFASDVTTKLSAFKGSVAGGIAAAGGNIAALPGTAMSMIEATISKPSIRRSGALSGDSGYLGNYTPYLIIERPVQALPDLYAPLKGYATRASGKISKFSGFLQVEDVDLSGIDATDVEKAEIERLLKEGIYL